jgi:predicted nucleic acid-binding protein
MSTIFLDTSALVRRYDRSEPGAASVRAICAPSRGHDLLIARFATVDVASALGRKARDGALTARQVARTWRTFQGHLHGQYQVVDLSDAVYARAERLLVAHALRAADAVHVGCALVAAGTLPPLVIEFWTADRRRAQVAAAEGLSVRSVG